MPCARVLFLSCSPRGAARTRDANDDKRAVCAVYLFYRTSARKEHCRRCCNEQRAEMIKAPTSHERQKRLRQKFTEPAKITPTITRACGLDQQGHAKTSCIKLNGLRSDRSSGNCTCASGKQASKRVGVDKLLRDTKNPERKSSDVHQVSTSR